MGEFLQIGQIEDPEYLKAKSFKEKKTKEKLNFKTKKSNYLLLFKGYAKAEIHDRDDFIIQLEIKVTVPFVLRLHQVEF